MHDKPVDTNKTKKEKKYQMEHHNKKDEQPAAFDWKNNLAEEEKTYKNEGCYTESVSLLLKFSDLLLMLSVTEALLSLKCPDKKLARMCMNIIFSDNEKLTLEDLNAINDYKTLLDRRIHFAWWVGSSPEVKEGNIKIEAMGGFEQKE